ncbi:MAG: hypothetical protein LBV61_01165 [Burkholderiaceae bacterium]|nr:hypothetical protein [Burkholderiaceae bacterium]
MKLQIRTKIRPKASVSVFCFMASNLSQTDFVESAGEDGPKKLSIPLALRVYDRQINSCVDLYFLAFDKK